MTNQALANVTLNAQQQAVIDYLLETGPDFDPVRVLAGPGAGKTTLLKYVYKVLVEELNVQPQNIIAVAYNRAMAVELGERIESVCDRAHLDQITTIHALCYRLLQREGDPRKPATDRQSWKIKAHAESVLEEIGWVGEVGWQDVMGFCEGSKGAGITPDRLEDYFTDMLLHEGTADPHKYGKLLARFRNEFDKRMRTDPDGPFMTFADMLYDAERILKEEVDVRQRYQRQYKYVIVDEAQDVGGQTYRILLLLAAPDNHLVLVGDRDQLLYRFAGAKPEYLGEIFEKEFPEGKTFKLETNYRSTQTIVRSQLKLVAPNYNDRNRHLMKNLSARPDAPEGEPIRFTTLLEPAAEGLYFADRIEELVQSGYGYGDIYMLARTRGYLAYMEGALARKQIPYVNIRGGSFWESGFVGILVGYMALAHNPHDDKAFETVYNVASKHMKMPFNSKKNPALLKGVTQISHRYLGNAFLNALKASTPNYLVDELQERESREPSYSDGLGFVQTHPDFWRWSDGYRDLGEFMVQLQRITREETPGVPTRLADYIVHNCLTDYIRLTDGVGGGDASNDSLEDLRVVTDIASQFETLPEFLAYIANLIAEAKKAAAGKQSEMVVLSTVHGVKGQERDVVLCPGWIEGVLPHARAVGNLQPSVISPLPGPRRHQEALNDEACIAFVAVSRAREIVEITAPAFMYQKPATTSRFVERLGLLPSAGEQAFGIPLLIIENAINLLNGSNDREDDYPEIDEG